MQNKKIISLFIAIVLIVTALLPVDYESFASVTTTQEDVPGVNSMDTLLTYPEFNSKVTDGAYLIPGLVSSVSYNKQTKHFATTQTMCPQAICKVNHYTLITAYDSSTNSKGASISKSVVYGLDSNNELVKTLVLPDSYHVGGIAFDSANGLILVAKASASAVGVISLDDFYKYLRFSSKFVNVNYTIEENDSNKFIYSASSVAYKNGHVYLGTFGAGSDSYAYCYTPIYNKAKNTYYLKYNYKFYLPSYTQGFSLTDYKGKLRMFASISYGRNETKGIYCSYLYTYTFNQSNGSKTLDNILSCPPMLELTYPEGGKLYCLFESAANIYRDVSRKPLSYVMPLKLSALCDEKQGSFVNINVSNVNNGKKIRVDCSLQNAKIYYSSSMPYYRYSKITSCSLYKKAYLKRNTGTVYAVAVVDNRIVAADAVYVSVSKAAAPSKLKIKSKSKTSIKIGWKAASKATSYEIYRSTSKSKKYKKVATVSASKKTFKDTKLKKNKKYYYKVRAVRKGYINSSFSNIVSTKTKK